MHVLFVTSEAFPLIKTGGLADVSGALPKAIKSAASFNGDIKVLLPAYRGVLSKLTAVKEVASIEALKHSCTLFSGYLPDSDVEVIAIKNGFIPACLRTDSDKPLPIKNSVTTNNCLAALLISSHVDENDGI